MVVTEEDEEEAEVDLDTPLVESDGDITQVCRSIALPALSVFLVFTCTLSVFPALTSLTRAPSNANSFKRLFVPLFLEFNASTRSTCVLHARACRRYGALSNGSRCPLLHLRRHEEAHRRRCGRRRRRRSCSWRRSRCRTDFAALGGRPPLSDLDRSPGTDGACSSLLGLSRRGPAGALAARGGARQVSLSSSTVLDCGRSLPASPNSKTRASVQTLTV